MERDNHKSRGSKKNAIGSNNVEGNCERSNENILTCNEERRTRVSCNPWGRGRT